MNLSENLSQFADCARTRRIAIAPMLDWTDRHERYFLRLITRHAWLYTEMVTTGAILHGERARFLDFHPAERPLALQLGGSVPMELAQCAKIGEDWGYDEINLNLGCPSDRVQSGRFGAYLMAEPQRVAECIAAMRHAVQIPVTVKTRIGIDHQEGYAPLHAFVHTLAAAGCKIFIIHARKAWLQGLSPKENREIPPLYYEYVHELKKDFPQLHISLNGGIRDWATVDAQLEQVDGVMIGREAYQNPYWLAQVDGRYYGDAHPLPTRQDILEQFIPYAQTQLAQGLYLSHLSRHLLGLFQGVPGARRWRRYISEHAHLSGAGVEVLQTAAAGVSATRLAAPDAPC